MTQEQYYWYVLRRQQLLRYKAAGYGDARTPTPVKDVGLCFKAVDNDTGIMLMLANSESEQKIPTKTPANLLTSNDGSTWGTYNFTLSCIDDEQQLSAYVGDHVALKQADDKVYFKAAQQISEFSNVSGDVYTFVLDGTISNENPKRVSVHNSVMWLIDPTGQSTTIPNAYCFQQLFLGCRTGLVGAPELPATTLKDYCYYMTFATCQQLSTPPELPATTLAEGCYNKMFMYCSRLTAAPELPAETLATDCYSNMFEECWSLETAPELPATTLLSGCYAGMFSGTSITDAPELSAEVMAPGCYSQMFFHCTDLTGAPELPAMTLADHCYDGMFSSCHKLKDGPSELPAKQLSACCYMSMFNECFSLTAAPRLLAQNLVDSCYEEMFINCSSLTSLSVGFLDWIGEDSTYNWVQGVAPSGTFFCSKLLSTEGVEHGYDTIPYGWDVSSSQGLRLAAQQDDSAVQLNFFTNNATVQPTDKLWYSRDCMNWSEYEFGEMTQISTNLSACYGPTINLENAGDHVYFMADGQIETFSQLLVSNYTFSLSGKIAASDSVMWLVDSTNSQTLSSMGTFYRLFSGCSALTQAPELPATTLTEGCYASMFKDCTSLSVAPRLIANSAPDFCFSGMFMGCSALTDISKIKLNSLSVGGDSYANMFDGCTSLITAPKLPATTLNGECYAGMFNGCASLVDTPYLPATTLANSCYKFMFAGCSSLTSTPYLSATTLTNRCYDRMFNGCSKINEISVAFTDWTEISNCTENWLSDVSNAGTFYCPYELSAIKDATHIPTNWNVIKTTPIDLTKGLVFSAQKNGSAVRFWNKSFTNTISARYSRDEGTTWTPYTTNMYEAPILTVDAGDSIIFKCPENGLSAVSKPGAVNAFYLSGQFKVCGNVAKLMNESGTQTSISTQDAYASLFHGNSSLVDAGDLILPANDLCSQCYASMFYYCTNLTSAPKFPAENLAPHCYDCAFFGCMALSTPPVLSSTTLARSCYNDMFIGCHSLISAPELPATTLAEYCYADMFLSCRSLAKIPVLSAQYPVAHCYDGMFYGCKNVKVAEGSHLGGYLFMHTSTAAASAESWSSNMLSGTGGEFTANPAIGKAYYCYS